MTQKEKITKSEEEILFPDITIAGIKIKPWSFGMLFDLGPLVEQVLAKMEEQNVDIESGVLSYKDISKLVTIATDPVFKIICLTTGETEEKIKSLNIGDGIKIAFTIYQQNKEQIIKNLTSPTQA